MKELKKRIEHIEEQLKMGQDTNEGVIVIKKVARDGGYKTLPEPVEEWLTYKLQQQAPAAKYIILDSDKELAARTKESGHNLTTETVFKNIRNETEGN